MPIQSSTKLLRPVELFKYDEVDLSCHVCASMVNGRAARAEGWYEDCSVEPGDLRQFYCREHVLLEDLDPDYPPNDRYLEGSPVTRRLPLMGRRMDDLFSGLVTHGKAGMVKEGWLWASLPVGEGFPLYRSVRPSPDVVEVLARMIYGDCNGNFDSKYYLQVAWVGEDEALLTIKYQQILGHRYLARIDRTEVREFFSRPDGS